MSEADGGGERAQLIVRNTFIDAVEPEPETGPDRTMSDQTGLRTKAVLKLDRLNSRVQPISEERAGIGNESFLEEDELGALGHHSTFDLQTHDGVHVEDEDYDMPLTRTQSLAYPAYSSFGAGAPTVEEMQAAFMMGSHASSAFPPGYQPPWSFPPYDLLGNYSGFPPSRGREGADGQEDSAPSDWQPSAPLGPPQLGHGPPIGSLHAFHQETRGMGNASPDFRQFAKVGFEGRLSVVSEKEVHTGGLHRYLVQFSAGELSLADGVGFVFSPRLPCAKNIQRIVSIFVNQRGRICMRVFAEILRASACVKSLELGDWVEMAINLDEHVVTFNIWPSMPNGWPVLVGHPSSTAVFPYGEKLQELSQASQKSVKLNTGHLACVVKNVGVTVTLAS